MPGSRWPEVVPRLLRPATYNHAAEPWHDFHNFETAINFLFFRLLLYFMDPLYKKTLVLGASDNPSRYSYLAINRLRAKGHPVVAIGRKKVKVFDVDVDTEKKPLQDIDTVSIYLNPANQKEYYNYVVSLHPKRIIFNPGAENEEFSKLAKDNGIQPMEACTLVLLGTGQF